MINSEMTWYQASALNSLRDALKRDKSLPRASGWTHHPTKPAIVPRWPVASSRIRKMSKRRQKIALVRRASELIRAHLVGGLPSRDDHDDFVDSLISLIPTPTSKPVPALR